MDIAQLAILFISSFVEALISAMSMTGSPRKKHLCSADLILLEQSLLVLRDGVLETPKRIGQLDPSHPHDHQFQPRECTQYGISPPFFPMRPSQILTQNLLYDFYQTGIPFDKVDDEVLTKPYQWKIPRHFNE